MAVWSQVRLSETPGLRIDPEYYQPCYLELKAKLEATNPVSVEDFAYVTDGIHTSPDWVESGGISYLSAKCVKDNYFDQTNMGQISQKQNNQNPRTKARLKDVLLTTVGTIGNAAVVYEQILPANMDRHLGIIRISKTRTDVDPYYLATFLNSKFGRFQTIRESTGNVQLNLFIDKIKKLLVPVGARFNEIGEITREAYDKHLQSKALYAEAEALLLRELGLDSLDLSPQIAHTANFSEAMEARRLDAEYFQPKYYRVMDAIYRSCNVHKPLGKIIEPVKNGFDYRVFVEEGTPYIRVGDIKNGRIYLDSSMKVPISKTDVGKNVSLKIGDVLFTRKGSFGNAAVVREGQDHSIISSEIMLLRVRENLNTQIIPDYLALFLNSELGYQQVERRVHGVAYYSITQPDLAKIEVAIPSISTQKRIAEIVQKALSCEIEAKNILEKAKHQVEEIILGDG